jgi:hypothetical protein
MSAADESDPSHAPRPAEEAADPAIIQQPGTMIVRRTDAPALGQQHYASELMHQIAAGDFPSAGRADVTAAALLHVFETNQFESQQRIAALQTELRDTQRALSAAEQKVAKLEERIEGWSSGRIKRIAGNALTALAFTVGGALFVDTDYRVIGLLFLVVGLVGTFASSEPSRSKDR